MIRRLRALGRFLEIARCDSAAAFVRRKPRSQAMPDWLRNHGPAKPKFTGLELYRRLIDTGRAIPTILVTAFPNDVDRVRALNDGVVCYLPKPVDEEHLTQCVCAALRSGDPPETDS